MKLLKKAFAVMAIATMSLSMVACGTTSNNTTNQATSEDGTSLLVARVGDVPVYKSALDNILAMNYLSEEFMPYMYGEDYTSNKEVVDQYNAFKENVVNSLVESEVIVLKAKKMKDIKVTEEEINEQVEATKASFANEEEFNAALEQSGMTLEEYKENVEKELYYNKLCDYYVKNDIKVTDEQIQDYYNKNIANYTTQPGANVYHILVDTEDKAKEVLEKYNAGTSFADLAAEYGTDGTKDQGGALGFIEYDTTQYDADFMAGVKELEEGEVSDPVKTQFGWHIIKVDGVQKEPVVKPLEDVKEEIKVTLENEALQTLLTEKVQEWKKDYDITIYEDSFITKVTEPKETEETTTESADQSATTESADQSTTTESADKNTATESTNQNATAETQSTTTENTTQATE